MWVNAGTFPFKSMFFRSSFLYEKLISYEYGGADVPDSALIIRKHSVATNIFSCLVFNELEGFNPRDQLVFAFVRDEMNPKMKINMFDVEVFEQVAVEYRHNLKQMDPITGLGRGGPKIKRSTTSGSHLRWSGGRCDGYLLKMWGESHEYD